MALLINTKKIREIRYTNNLKKVIPYCKDQLVMNEIPHVISIVGQYYGGDMIFNVNILNAIDGCRYELQKYHSDESYTIIFLYYLISGIATIDKRSDAMYALDDIEYGRITSSYNDILEYTPHRVKSLPVYVLVLLDVIGKYQQGQLKKVYGRDLSQLTEEKLYLMNKPGHQCFHWDPYKMEYVITYDDIQKEFIKNQLGQDFHLWF